MLCSIPEAGLRGLNVETSVLSLLIEAGLTINVDSRTIINVDHRAPFRAPSPQLETCQMTQILDTDLDDLLAEAMEQKKARGGLAEKKKALKGKVDAGDVRRLSGEIRDAEITSELIYEGSVGLFWKYECKCGTEVSVFQGFMDRYRHKTDKFLRKGFVVPQPRQRTTTMEVHIHEVKHCAVCFGGQEVEYMREEVYVIQ